MKQITREEVKPIPDLSDRFIGLEDQDGARWRLCSEDKGYIFRQKVGGSIGHSGHKPTKRELCHHAFYYSKQIVSFETETEFETWITEVEPKWKE